MADKTKLFIQKRTTLKSQITNLTNLVSQGRTDSATLRLRITRLTALYHAFEDYNDELAILDPDGGHNDEFSNIQERFYAIAGRVENILHDENASVSNAGASTSGSRGDDAEPSASTKKRRIKLPEASLPTFDGKYENWLSFKNAFNNMIDTQPDLSDVDKLHYLRSALVGEAAGKVRLFAINGINYRKAWDVLERSYEVKRILITRHLSAILNLPVVEREDTSSLSQIADDAQQHAASLKTLGVQVGSEMLVHILENKLPKRTIEKWEATLDRDEFPTIDQLYEFLYKTAVCASRRDRSRVAESQGSQSALLSGKRRKIQSNQAFTLNVTNNCAACKTRKHPLYLCHEFKRLPVHKRIEIVKLAKLCYNCLRSHRGQPCKFSACTICQKRHNTLLHSDKYASTNNADAAKVDTAKTD